MERPLRLQKHPVSLPGQSRESCLIGYRLDASAKQNIMWLFFASNRDRKLRSENWNLLQPSRLWKERKGEKKWRWVISYDACSRSNPYPKTRPSLSHQSSITFPSPLHDSSSTELSFRKALRVIVVPHHEFMLHALLILLGITLLPLMKQLLL